jgi:MMP 1-O-methyltransferase
MRCFGSTLNGYVARMDAELRRVARDAKGFMPEDEGMALHDAAIEAPPGLPMMEIGSYCGKSTVYIGVGARAIGNILYTIDHHRGSEEHQPGEEYHDPDLVDDFGRVDTLPELRKTIHSADLHDVVVPIVGDSTLVARNWGTPLGFVFIDGGHSASAASADYEGWAPHVTNSGVLAIHDVFEDPTEGGRPPFEIYSRAISSGAFEEIGDQGSLRVLRRVSDGL